MEGDGVGKSTLRPPPLFRSIGLTGLSASLPPHRRLRSALHRARAVLPANSNANEAAHSWPQAPSRASERGLPLKGHIRSSLHMNLVTHDLDSLPDIVTHKLGLPQQEITPRRESHVREPKILTFASSQAQADKGKHLHLRPNISLTNKMLIPARTAHRQNNAAHNPPPKTHRRRSTVSPFTQSEVHSSETGATTERLAEKRKEKWRRRKINITGIHSQSERLLTPEKGQEDNICQWLSSLGITDREKDQRECQRESNRQGRRLESVEKGACPTRRDRRPHFLPPISQSDCLLNVPLVLPENSPPPSPSCVPSDPFFPLQVPALPLWTEHRLKHT
ncbi:uncharacterized protein LOC118805307 [Colossoma macropomum]|uniref:uncharacterized protein LOC118805307 n=1 Tax=Colossoma macropomum TaxID=42526 RepID=UPI001863F9A5|nr:uncharacterized protein LOC118805307 [Colossoma macropomum]XP_036421914.1 uncharacterized protein LOC118805307 [Colossoma macropomum]XP_036421915.1 uncharacterized protein LOC118805307 [Colossoma macropomum]